MKTAIASLAALLALGTGAIGQTALKTQLVVSGLTSPLYLTSPRGDMNRLFIVERGGAIKIVKDGALLATPFLNLAGTIVSGGERGLLGLAFHPNYAQNGYFFVNYTRSGDGATMVVRYQVSAANPDVANAASATTMLGPIAQPYTNHNGGCLQFGPDGYLYIGTGDGGSAGDPSCNAQNPQSLLGKMLRIDVDNPNSRIPATNPFVGNTAYRGEIWSIGLRNPWRFTFDRDTGDMWIADVGQNALEEVHFAPGTSAGGENYGWKIMEGTNCYSTTACTAPPACNSSALKLPVHTYGRTSGFSISGGYVYRGCAIPDLRGTYFFADYGSGAIWSFRYNGIATTNFTTRTTELRPTPTTSITSISSFGQDACGELYIVSLAGSVHKIVPVTPNPTANLGFGEVGSSGIKPYFAACGQFSPDLELRLENAPANTAGILFFSLNNQPTPIAGIGTFVPFPVQGQLPLVFTDARGRYTTTLPDFGQYTIYGQWGLIDTALTSGVVLSNAAQIVLP
ncbi:MAG: hypothetical protein RL148_691 [Planctomycetota bacterium]|jgi:glucose/arabinose dehydrogenase